MKNYILFLVLLIVLFNLDCSNDTSGVKGGNGNTELQIEVLEGSITANRLEPNINNPGSYPIDTDFIIELTNPIKAETLYVVSIDTVKLFLSPDNTLLGVVGFDGASLPQLAPGETDTIIAERHTGHNDIYEQHCNRTIYCRFTISDDSGATVEHSAIGLALECIP